MNFHTLVVRMGNVATTSENSLVVPKNVQHRVTL